MFKKRGQGQSWSLDIILAFVIFVLIIGIFYALLSNDKEGDKTQSLMLESNTVISNLDATNGQNSNLTIISKGSIDEDKLEDLYNSDYDTLKRELGIKGDFCIYVVRQDGTLVTITENKSGQNITVGGFGNGNFSVNNAPCGYNVTN
jgi:hypothetical protein